MKKSAVRRFGLPVIVTIAAAAALTGLTGDVSARGAARPEEETAPRQAGEPIMAVVSIKSQNVTFYDADGWILKAPVSTGVKGRETPAGVFAVLQKNIDHRSNLYDDAHMPHMQRLTWNGIAMHGGPLPGYAASHGCVRMPYGFASELFDKTRIGMRVIISPEDAPPVEFSHAALLVPNAEAVAAAPARAEALAREAAEAAKAIDETKKAAKLAARENASAKAALRKLERQKSSADEDLADAEKALDKARSGEAKAQEQRLKAADAGAKLDIGKAEPDATVEAAAKPADAAKAERQKSSADADLADAEKALASARSNVVKAEERRLKAAAKATEAAAKLDTIRADATAKADAAAKAAEAAKAAVTRKTETAKVADDAKLALVPVSIYISRATQKLYVRRNTQKAWPDGGEVFDATIEVPVTIRDPERPIGTHVYTAMAEAGAGLRWTAVSLENGDGAKEALDRVSIPQDVLDRIAPTALPRSSIIVSDEPLSKETNYRTEFVAVLNDQPQGGFKTRKPTPPVAPWGAFPASGNNWQPGFFNFWDQPNQKQQPSNKRRRAPNPVKPGFW
jgi:hypothetical protein